MWSLRDYPDLALRVAELPVDGAEAFVRREDMLAFLGTYGPLTWSILPEGLELEQRRVFAQYVADPRATHWLYQFSRPVALVRAVAERLESSPPTIIGDCMSAVDVAPPDSLLRGLLSQLLVMALKAERPRTCAGCGRLFTKTEDASGAIHRQGWKRGDAKYHSKRCGKAFLERRRRAALKAERDRATEDVR